MQDVRAIEDVRLPDSYEEERRLGDLWQERRCCVVWLRHYGWTFCREQVAQLRDHQQEIEDGGTGLAAVGMGWPEMAADFRERFDITFPLLVDRTKETYRALDFPRAGWLQLIGPKQIVRGMMPFLSGAGLARPRQDPTQLGGLLVIETSGDVSFMHRATEASDNVPVEELLRVLA